jgi:hypothetical protein
LLLCGGERRISYFSVRILHLIGKKIAGLIHRDFRCVVSQRCVETHLSVDFQTDDAGLVDRRLMRRVLALLLNARACFNKP